MRLFGWSKRLLRGCDDRPGGAHSFSPWAGILDIANNARERQIRPVALGRKNFLFVGSDHGGDAAAVAYSQTPTCKLNVTVRTSP